MTGIECELCNFTAKYKSQMDIHKKSKFHIRQTQNIDRVYKYTCTHCNWGTDAVKAWSNHCRSKRHLKLQGETEFQCEKCSVCLHSQKALTFHQRTCDFVQHEPPQPPPNETNASDLLPDIDTLVQENSELKSQLSQLSQKLGKFDAMMNDINELKQWQVGEERQRCGICFNLQDRTKKLQKHTMKGVGYEICGECCLEITGYSSKRAETIVREYLQRHYKQPMLVANKKVKGDACLNYLPDIVYADPNRVVIVEIDENGHRGRSYECDQRRMSDIYDEFAGKTVVWVRFNSDAYPGGNKDVYERLPELQGLLERIETMEFDTMIHLFYMYYDQNWQNVAKDLPKTFMC